MKLVYIDNEYYLLDGIPDKIKVPACEKLTTGEWILWPIDTLNNLDPSTQLCIIASTRELKYKDTEGRIIELPMLDKVRCNRHVTKYYLETICNKSFEAMGYHSTITPHEENQFKLGWKIGYKENHYEWCKKTGIRSDVLLLDTALYHSNPEWEVKIIVEQNFIHVIGMI